MWDKNNLLLQNKEEKIFYIRDCFPDSYQNEEIPIKIRKAINNEI